MSTQQYVLGQCKKLKKAGCNVLLIQKSILRDAYNDLSLHFLAKMDIMVVTDVERPDIDFIARTLGCRPVAHIDSFTPDKVMYHLLFVITVIVTVVVTDVVQLVTHLYYSCCGAALIMYCAMSMALSYVLMSACI